MSATSIILRKDLQLYRWGWIAALVLAAVEIYLHGTTVGMIENQFNESLGTISAFGQALLPFFLFALVSQKENLVDPEAYWLGRPLPRLQILGAKLIFVAIILGILAAANTAVLLLNGGFLRAPYALAGFFPVFAAWLSVVFLGAQTKSLPRLLAVIVFLYIGLLVLGFLGSAILPLTSVIEDFFNALPMLPFDTPGNIVVLVQTVFWCATGIAILGFYYKTRRQKTAWIALLICAILSPILTPTNHSVDPSASEESTGGFQATIVGIEKVGTQSSNQGTSNRYAIILELDDSRLPGDKWIRPQSVSLVSPDREDFPKYIDVIRQSQMIRSTHSGSPQKIRVNAFFLDTQITKLVDDASIDVTLFADISTYATEEVGRIPIRPDQGFADNGNRFIISSFSENPNRTELQVSAYLPSPVFEESEITGSAEVFEGKYSFGLAVPGTAEILPFDMGKRSFSFSSSHSASLEIQPPIGTVFTDCELVIYRRVLIDEDSGTFRGEGITLPPE